MGLESGRVFFDALQKRRFVFVVLCNKYMGYVRLVQYKVLKSTSRAEGMPSRSPLHHQPSKMKVISQSSSRKRIVPRSQT
jgi:hypothetical protein